MSNYVTDLPFGEIATSMGLLKLPKMPEIKNRKITGFCNDKKFDLNEIKYKYVIILLTSNESYSIYRKKRGITPPFLPSVIQLITQ